MSSPLTAEEAIKRGIRHRAPAGGAFAFNGVFYPGGQFYEPRKIDPVDHVPATPKYRRVEVDEPDARAWLRAAGLCDREIDVAMSLAARPVEYGDPRKLDLVRDLARKTFTRHENSPYGDSRLSPKQIDLLRKLIAPMAFPPAEPEPVGAAPLGRTRIVGRIVNGVWKCVQVSPFRAIDVFKVLILCEATEESGGPFKVHCSLSQTLLNGTTETRMEEFVGRRVEMTVTLEPKESDPSFAFGSRPSKTTLLGEKGGE